MVEIASRGCLDGNSDEMIDSLYVADPVCEFYTKARNS